jgi:glycosyltransferase involved in cell wall biosynthesis
MEIISVIMSVYNERSEWLTQAIDSILNQTYSFIEFIIILDNPNNFEAKNIIESYVKKDKRIIFIENESNLGLVKSLNKAIKISKGDYIARMDADDISLDTRLQTEIKYLSNMDNIGLVASNIIYMNEDNEFLYKSNYTRIKDGELKKSVLKHDPFPHPTWMIKREVLEELKCYREINSAEDFDFICRAIIRNIGCDIIEEPLLYYRLRSNSITISNKMRQIFETERIKKEYIKSIIRKKDFLSVLDCKNIDTYKFERFSKAIKKLEQAKQFFAQGKKIKYIFKIIDSSFTYIDRIKLKIYVYFYCKFM